MWRAIPAVLAAVLRETLRFLTLSPRSRLHQLVMIGAQADLRMADGAGGRRPRVPAVGRNDEGPR